MSTQNIDSPQITLESLNEQRTIPVLGWNSTDTWFVLGVGLLCGFIGLRLGLGLAPSIPLALIGLYVGYDVVRSSPPYCSVMQWLRTVARYYREPSVYANTAEAHIEVDNTIRAAIETPKTTRDLTGVKRFYPPHGIIEQRFGTYAMMLRYTPPNMDFSTQEEYLELSQLLAEGYNKSIDFDVTLHATTRPVDMEAYFEQLAQRVDDPDVKNNDIFAALLEEMLEDRRQMLERSDTEIVHFYLIITVDESEVEEIVGGDDDAAERSRLFSFLRRGDEDEDMQSERVKERRIKKKLDNRARKLKGLIEGNNDILEDASVDRVSTTEAAAVLESYWTGESVPLEEEGDLDPVPVAKVSHGPDRPEDIEEPEVSAG